MIWNDYVIKGQITLFVGALHHSHRCVKFDAYRSCGVEINVILTHDSTWPNNRKEISRGKWEPLNLSLHFIKFGTNRSCGSRDMYLFCCITWPHDQKNMWLGKWDPLNLSHQCAMSDILSYLFLLTFLFCQVISCDHTIKGTFDLASGISSGLGLLEL